MSKAVAEVMALGIFVFFLDAHTREEAETLSLFVYVCPQIIIAKHPFFIYFHVSLFVCLFIHLFV